MSNMLEANIECPFYVANKLNQIYCESPIPGTQGRFVFDTMKEKTDYIKTICSCNGGKGCPYCRARNFNLKEGSVIMFGFVVGLLIGTTIGVVVTGLCAESGGEDDDLW